MTAPRASMDDVRHAYRLLLGREPDPTGLGDFSERLRRERPTTSDVAAIVMSSPEYKAGCASPLAEIEFHGLKIYPWRGDRLIGDPVAAGAAYEPHLLPLFIASIPVGGTVLDIGANIGTFTLVAARKVGDAGHVYAIEPIARNVQSICAGVLGNGLRNVSVIPVAASASAQVLPILREENSSNGIVDPHADPRLADAMVPAERLDFLLHGIARLDVIKMDIEGHEPLAWPGLVGLVRRFRPVIFSEFSPVAIKNHSRIEPERYLEMLFEHASVVEVARFDGTQVGCAAVEQVMHEWKEANRRMGMAGTCHLDLVVRTAR